jgi:DNA repair protein RadD
MLRDYQARAIEELYQWFRNNETGNPCLVLPTGAGKSHIVAALCKDIVTRWPDKRILMLTHVKELIEQNAKKMREHWKNAPMGIYSSGMKRFDLSEQITFAGIQSVRKKHEEIGYIDLIIIDECHLVSHKDEGGYRMLIKNLTEINPKLRVVGLTATPWRLGHGLITEKPAIFDAIVEPVSIIDLIENNYLSPLKSKLTVEQLNVSGVQKRGGEYIESELQKAVDKDDVNSKIVEEVLRVAGDRKAWLFFCTGVEHAVHIKDQLVAKGIESEVVTGDTPIQKRNRIINDFKAGKIKALTNANVLTTGFDYPDIDLIAMLRPTLSPSLYVQMAGRGMRLKSHTDHCLVLDFAGNVSKHGPITNVKPPSKKGQKEGICPVKVCPKCFELVHPSLRKCSSCGYEFPETEKEQMFIHGDDIMGIEGSTMIVSRWKWETHVGLKSKQETYKVSYYCDNKSIKPVVEYFATKNSGAFGIMARKTVQTIANRLGLKINVDDIDGTCKQLNQSPPPFMIDYTVDGNFFKILLREWNVEKNTTRTG